MAYVFIAWTKLIYRMEFQIAEEKISFHKIYLNRENLLKYWPRKRWWWKEYQNTSKWMNKYIYVYVSLAACKTCPI